MRHFRAIVGEVPRLAVVDAPASLELSSDGTITFTTLDIPAETRLVVEVPEGWQVSPSQQWLEVGDGTATVTVRAPQTGTSGVITATLHTKDGRTHTVDTTIALVDPAEVQIDAVVAWDSQEVVGEAGQAFLAIDGDPSTFWHTAYNNNGLPASNAQHPHYIVVDLGAETTLTSLTYVPRPPAGASAGNGQIAEYRIDIPTAGTFRTRRRGVVAPTSGPPWS